MKNLLYTFLAFGLFFSCSENKENDLDKANLKGKVESVYTTYNYATEKLGEIKKGDKKWNDGWWGDRDNKFYFNEEGNRIEKKGYYINGELQFNWKYKRGDNGNLIEIKKYDEDEYLTNKYKYKYDDRGNVIKVKKYDKDGELENESSYKYEFDDKENWIQQIIFKDDKPTDFIEREIKYYD